MKRALHEVAEYLGVALIGDGRAEVSGVASLRSAKMGELVFVESPKDLTKALESPASGVIAGEFARGSTHAKPLLTRPDSGCVLARAVAGRGNKLARQS